MLATRIALNEALYLRREVPPSFPPERRHVLIDSGLRMWGVPRVFSTAVALSLAATGGAKRLAFGVSGVGDQHRSDRSDDRDGLISHLGTLELTHQDRALANSFSVSRRIRRAISCS